MLFWTKEHKNIFFILILVLKSVVIYNYTKKSISGYKSYPVAKLILRMLSSHNTNAGFKDLLADER